MREEADHRVPVLIVGGSLVGLSASLFLGRHGVRHTLVERHPGTSVHPRGRGNNARTMELFRVAGIEQDVRTAASLLTDNHGILQAPSLLGDAGAWLFRHIDPDGGLARLSPAAWCLCSQNDLEPVLLDGARELGGDLRYSHELESFVQDPEGVTAVVLDGTTGRRYTVRADYLVAADGPRSPVRRSLGIAQTGPGDLFANVSVTFRSRLLADAVGDRRFLCCYLIGPDADGPSCPSTTRRTGSSTSPGTRSGAKGPRSSPTNGARGTSAGPPGSGASMWRSPARRPGTPPNASRSGSPPAGCSSPGTPPTRCPHRGVRFQHRHPGRPQPGLEAGRRPRRLGGARTAGDLRHRAPAGRAGHGRPRVGPVRGTRTPGLRTGPQRGGGRETERPAQPRPGPPLPRRRGRGHRSGSNGCARHSAADR